MLLILRKEKALDKYQIKVGTLEIGRTERA
jgi:hypothetical protein